MLAKFKDFALCLAVVAIVLGGDYCVRELFHAVQVAKAAPAEIAKLNDRIAKLEQKTTSGPTAVPNYPVTPLPTTEEVVGPAAAKRNTSGKPLIQPKSAEDEKEGGTFTLLTQDAHSNLAKATFKLVGEE